MWLYVTPRSNNQPNNVAAYFRGCPGVPVHEGIPIVFITIHGLMTQFVIVSFFCVPVHEDTTLFSWCCGEYCGCPVDLVIDLGTENWIIAAIQSFFRDDPDSHRYVPSPRNQRIEALISHQTWFYLTIYALNARKMPHQIHRCTTQN